LINYFDVGALPFFIVSGRVVLFESLSTGGNESFFTSVVVVSVADLSFEVQAVKMLPHIKKTKQPITKFFFAKFFIAF
jgi:hypothetical protein